MELQTVEALAHELMEKHGLKYWRFEFDRSRRRFGCCHYDARLITMSAALSKLNEEAKIRDTILHEIAHGLAPRSEGHGAEWRRIAMSIGCNGERTYSAAKVVLPPLPWRVSCDSCGYANEKARRRVLACRSCCTKYSGGHFDPKYLLRWTRQGSGLAIAQR